MVVIFKMVLKLVCNHISVSIEYFCDSFFVHAKLQKISYLKPVFHFNCPDNVKTFYETSTIQEKKALETYLFPINPKINSNPHSLKLSLSYSSNSFVAILNIAAILKT
jgi:hypothetical protein